MATENVLYSKEGLLQIGDEYTALASQLRTNIESFGELINELTTAGVQGAEAPATLLNTWNNGGNGEVGVHDAMLSYSDKLDEAALNLEAMAQRTATADTSLGEAASTVVQVQQA